MTPGSVLIVGAGISGLALAHRLHRHGRDVTLMDAGETPGGNLRTEAVSTEAGDWRLDLGPNSFSDTLGVFDPLIEELHLADQVVTAGAEAGRRFLFLDGRLQELPSKPPRLLLSSVLPLSARLRLLGEPWVRRRPPDAPPETLAAFCDRRLGRAVRERLLTPFVGGIYAGDPERLGAADAFPTLVELEREHGSLLRGMRRRGPPGRRPTPANFDGGMATLPRAMAAALGPRCRTQRPVTRVEPVERGYRVTTPDGPLETESLVLATPAHTTADLLDELLPDAAPLLRGIRYAPMVVAHVGLRTTDCGALPPGFGFLVPRGEGVRILGAVRASRLFPGRAPEGHELVTVFVGGELDPTAIELGDDELRRVVRDDLRRLAGVVAEPTLFRVTRWPRAIPQYEVGHTERLERIDELLAPRHGIHLLGNWRGGISMPQCVQSAEALARRLVNPENTDA